MTNCHTQKTVSSNACSGKCRGSACSNAPKIWVVAACEGRISLFEKNKDGTISPNPQGELAAFSSPNQFQQLIGNAEKTHQFDQLVLVGSAGDIAWVHSFLPQQAAGHVTAEIKYPLLANWFNEPLPMPYLTKALQGILN